jgi:hypothetical protein
MHAWIVAISFVVVSLFAGDALANPSAKDISWSDKACCCKAGCPDGSYFCQGMCQLLGASCSLSASSVPDGAVLTLRESCTGASWSFWSGLQCPATCPANSGS